MSGGHMNLSLLSRGVGEVQQNGHEKVEVKLEPEDYFNWLDDSRHTWKIPVAQPARSLSPITTHRTNNTEDITPRSIASIVSSHPEFHMPRTFTTRKGALLLFSEDYAQKGNGRRRRKQRESQSAEGPNIKTVDDLAKSILAYGASKSFSHDEPENSSVYLGFVHSRSRKYYERQFKPGFSAKRYLSSWTKLWDYNLLSKMTDKGYLKQSQHQKKTDFDVSGIPLPYRILRQWLYAPGTLDSYTFRRTELTDFFQEEDTMDLEEVKEDDRPASAALSRGSIKVASLMAQAEVDYAELDSTTKESILTELLVKSAITHAIRKQKEFQSAVDGAIDEEEERKASEKLYEFDMMQAIQSALNTNGDGPAVAKFELDPLGMIPGVGPKATHKGFRGTKGVGLAAKADMTSLSSVRSGSPILDGVSGPPSNRLPSLAQRTSDGQISLTRSPVIPPIASDYRGVRANIPINIEPPTPQRTMLSMPGRLTREPTLVTTAEDIREFASASQVDDDDEEYISWRRSVLSDVDPNTQSGTLTKSDKTKSLQSLTKVTVEADVILGLPTDVITPPSYAVTPASAELRSAVTKVHLEFNPGSVNANVKSPVSPLSGLGAAHAVPIQQSSKASSIKSSSKHSSPRVMRRLQDLQAKGLKSRSQATSVAGDDSSDNDEDKSSGLKKVSSLDLINQAGLDSDEEKDDKKSVLSLMSKVSKSSQYSGYEGAKPYTKGITARQVVPLSEVEAPATPPDEQLADVDEDVGMPVGDLDPNMSITAWTYQQPAPEPPAIDPRLEESLQNIEKQEAEEDVASHKSAESSVAKSVPASEASHTTSPFSIPGAALEGLTPIQLPRLEVEEEEPSRENSVISEGKLLEILTDQARVIAKNVLESGDTAGVDLAQDAKLAAEMLMHNLPGSEVMSEAASAAEGGEEDEAGDGEEPHTVGEMVKEGMEKLVNVIDLRAGENDESSGLSESEHVTMAESEAAESEYDPSIPSADGYTPSERSLLLSQQSSSVRDSLSGALSRPLTHAESLAASVPSAAGQHTPSVLSSAPRSMLSATSIASATSFDADSFSDQTVFSSDIPVIKIPVIDDMRVDSSASEASSRNHSIDSCETLIPSDVRADSLTSDTTSSHQTLNSEKTVTTDPRVESSISEATTTLSFHSLDFDKTKVTTDVDDELIASEVTSNHRTFEPVRIPYTSAERSDLSAGEGTLSHYASYSEKIPTSIERADSLTSEATSNNHMLESDNIPTLSNKRTVSSASEATSSHHTLDSITRLPDPLEEVMHYDIRPGSAIPSSQNSVKQAMTPAGELSAAQSAAQTPAPLDRSMSAQSATSKQEKEEQAAREAASKAASIASAKSEKSSATKTGSAGSKQSSPESKSEKSGKLHEKEFVVGNVPEKKELQQLYAPMDPPPPAKQKKTKPAKSVAPKPAPPKKEVKKKEPVAKKQTKPKAKVKKTKAPPAKVATPPKPKTPTPEPPPPPKEPTPVPVDEYEEWKTPEPEEEEDMEFIIVRDESDDEEQTPKPVLGSVKSLNYSRTPEQSIGDSLVTDEEDIESYDSIDEEDEDGMFSVSNHEARAAKRAAEKERRRRDVERRRREREEAIRKEKEDAERKERIRLQMEEERQRREEEARMKKERERLERERLEHEEEERQKRFLEAEERERKKKEEQARYMAEMKRKAEEEEQRRKELQALRDAEEAERLHQEKLLLEQMAEEERAEYLRRKAEEDRLRAIAEEQARIRREEEAKRMWEELQRQEEERKRAEEMLRQRLMFQRSLNLESGGMEHTQDITRAFVFSYYELLKWLGYELPEWAKYGPTGDVTKDNHPDHSNH